MRAADYDPHKDRDSDLFARLGAPWGCDGDDLKRAWRAATLAHHPDMGGSQEAFIGVQYAWEVLSDPTCRSMYMRAYESRHPPRQETSASASGSRGGGAGTGSGQAAGGEQRHRRSEQRGCTGVNADGSLCRNEPIAGKDRCTLHFSQSDEEIARILRRYARTLYCTGTTRDGVRCGNPASVGSDRCWLHGGDRAGASGTGAGQRRRKPPWRCEEPVRFQGSMLRCHYNRLVGADRCWDHATAAQRQAAVMQVQPGRCAAVTQRGEPCSKARSSLGFPLCDSHLTVGIFGARGGAGTAGGEPSPAPPREGPSPPTEPHGESPSATSEVACPGCGKKNRVGGEGLRRCGACGAVFRLRAGAAEPTGAPTGPRDRAGPGGLLVSLEGVGMGQSRAFDIPVDVTQWQIRWECGPDAVYPLLDVSRVGGLPIGDLGGGGLRSGHGYFHETGRFYLESQIEDWWKADVYLIGDEHHEQPPPSAPRPSPPRDTGPAERPSLRHPPAPAPPAQRSGRAASPPTEGTELAHTPRIPLTAAETPTLTACRPEAAPPAPASLRATTVGTTGSANRDLFGRSSRPRWTDPWRTRWPPGWMVAAAALVATVVVSVVALLAVGAYWRQDQSVTVSFDRTVKDSSADCSSESQVSQADVAAGFELTCTMIDAAPGNSDRPYVQVRLEGCDDWQRLDHDDSPDAVAITAHLEPCDADVGFLEWQVCQTHGGPYSDDCVDGSEPLTDG